MAPDVVPATADSCSGTPEARLDEGADQVTVEVTAVMPVTGPATGCAAPVEIHLAAPPDDRAVVDTVTEQVRKEEIDADDVEGCGRA